MKCQRCDKDIPEGESFEHLGQTLCEDCYMDALNPNQACNPWAVYTATRTRETGGQQGIEGLSPVQKAIYDFIIEKGRTTADEVMCELNISRKELENQFATLRHCELARGEKDGGTVYLVPFS
jgi:hypothetical protein